MCDILSLCKENNGFVCCVVQNFWLLYGVYFIMYFFCGWSLVGISDVSGNIVGNCNKFKYFILW